MKPRLPAPEELLTTTRQERIGRVIANRTRSITAVLEEVHDPHNQSAVLRTCECFGIQDVHVVEGPTSPFKPAKLVVRGATRWLDLHRSKDILSTIEGLKREGYLVLASSLGGAAIELPSIPVDRKVALIFGNESRGVSPAAIAASDGTFVIPMYGFTQSLNISVAAAVSLSWLALRRASANGGSPGDLSPEEASELKERFEFGAVRQRRRIYGSKTLPRPVPRAQEES